MSLTSLMWGVLFCATRVALLAQGHAIEQDIDNQNQALRANCLRPSFRDGLGTKSHICDDVTRETATWPITRAVDHVWQRTFLCGSPCSEVAAVLVSNPLNLVLVVCALAVLPYVSALLARTSQHAANFNPPRFAALEDGMAWGRKSKFQ
jgi:hypothetical protein